MREQWKPYEEQIIKDFRAVTFYNFSVRCVEIVPCSEKMAFLKNIYIFKVDFTEIYAVHLTGVMRNPTVGVGYTQEYEVYSSILRMAISLTIKSIVVTLVGPANFAPKGDISLGTAIVLLQGGA